MHRDLKEDAKWKHGWAGKTRIVEVSISAHSLGRGPELDCIYALLWANARILQKLHSLDANTTSDFLFTRHARFPRFSFFRTTIG